MGNIVDRTIIRTALATDPQLRENLRALVQRIAAQAFAETDLGAIERELIDSLTVSEAMGMPSSLPAVGQPLTLSSSQWTNICRIVARFRDGTLRSRVEAELAAAVTAGRILIS